MGISSSGTASIRSWTCRSSVKKATTMLVSSSRLPFIEVHPLAPLLDGLDHLAAGLRVQDAGKAPEVSARDALGRPRGKAMNEFSGACLLLGRQSIQIAENLFLDR